MSLCVTGRKHCTHGVERLVQYQWAETALAMSLCVTGHKHCTRPACERALSPLNVRVGASLDSESSLYVAVCSLTCARALSPLNGRVGASLDSRTNGELVKRI